MDEQPITRENAVMGEVDYSNLPYVLSLFIFILSMLIFYVWRKARSDRRDILLTGLSEAGKTYLFTQFLFSEDRETYSSISTNVADFSTDKGLFLRFVDIPGNERLRYKFIDQYKPLAKGIIFVVDSVTLQKDVRDVADFLYTILADTHLSSVPVLILCNKQDETMAKGEVVIKALLEKELNLVRTTRCSGLQSVDDSSGNDQMIFLGKQGTDFTFSQLAKNVDVMPCSAKERNFECLTQWIHSL